MVLVNNSIINPSKNDLVAKLGYLSYLNYLGYPHPQSCMSMLQLDRMVDTSLQMLYSWRFTCSFCMDALEQKCFCIFVGSQVALQVRFLREGHGTELAFVRPLACVDANVYRQVAST